MELTKNPVTGVYTPKIVPPGKRVSMLPGVEVRSGDLRASLGMVMLSNMYAFGGEVCANEMYHTWFGNNTPYDNALSSPKGPAPGYLTGGPNKDFSYTQLSPPASQPPQKSYLDFNDGWPQSSWEITEPAIYYNAGYILLLSNFSIGQNVPTKEPSDDFPESSFSVFPNPVSDTFTIQFPDAKQRTVRLTDAAGKVILDRESTDVEILIKTKGLPAGTYSVGVNGVWKQVIKQ